MDLKHFVDGEVEEDDVGAWSPDNMPLSKTIGSYVTFLVEVVVSNLAYLMFYI